MLLVKVLLHYLLIFALGVFLALGVGFIQFFPLILLFGFFVHILNDSKNKFFLKGFVFGYGYFLASFYWIPLAIFKNPVVSVAWVPVFIILLPVPLAFFIGLIASFSSLFKRNKVLFSLNFSFLWVLLEFIKDNLFFSLPLSLFGNISLSFLYFAQGLSLIGLYGISLLLATASSSVFSRNIYYLTVNFILILMISIDGQHRIDVQKREKFEAKKIIRVVQPNIQEYDFHDEDIKTQNLQKLIALTQKDGLSKVDYVVWPESALPYVITKDAMMKKFINKLLPYEKNKFLITGAERREVFQDETFNSLIAINKEGLVHSYYDKKTLVPFGEYIPSFFRWLFFNKLSNSYQLEDYAQGNGDKVLHLDDNYVMIPTICSEGFQKIDDIKTSKGLHHLPVLNVSNEIWFNHSTAPYHIFNTLKIKAIELGIAIIKAGNVGFSGFINAEGKVDEESQLNTEEVLDINVSQLYKSFSFYQKFQKFEIVILFTSYFMLLVVSFSLRNLSFKRRAL